MATRWAVANGNWSNPTTWDGGISVPGIGDNVYADGKIVTINQNINVLSLRNSQRSGGTIGGYFSTGAYILTCNIYASATSSPCIYQGTGGISVVIIGNIYGGSGAQGYSALSAAGTLVVTGDVYGGSGSISEGIYGSGTFNVTVTGNVYAGTGCRAIFAGASLTVTGNVTALSIRYAVYSPIVTIVGIVTADSIYAVYCDSTVNITGTLNNNAGNMAIYAPKIYLNPTASTVWLFQTSVGGAKSLYTTDVFVGIPLEADVRSGAVYGITNEKTGTLVVPSPSNVLQGVLTDNTVGSLLMSPADFITALKADVLGQRLSECALTSDVGTPLATIIDSILKLADMIASLNIDIDPLIIINALKADVLGQRLANCSTVETTGQQLIALH